MLRGRIVRTAMAELAPRIMRKTLHPQSKITDFDGHHDGADGCHLTNRNIRHTKAGGATFIGSAR